MSTERLRYSFRASYKLMIDVLNASELLPECITRNLVSFDEKASIASEKTIHSQNDALLSLIYRKSYSDPTFMQRFVEMLEDLKDSLHLTHVIEGLRTEVLEKDKFDMTAGPMDEMHYRVLRASETAILKTLDASHLLPSLITEGVVSIEENESIRTFRTRQEMVSHLIDVILKRGSPTFKRFIEVLVDSSDSSVRNVGISVLKQFLSVNGLHTTSSLPGRQPEATAFRKTMGKLMTRIFHPEEVAIHLYAAHIITKSTLDAALSYDSSTVMRTAHLLEKLESQIQANHRRFHDVVEVLCEQANLVSLGELLSRTYEQVRDCSQKNLLQPDVESHTTIQSSLQMTTYVEFLKRLYSKHFPDGAKWPQLRTKKYINLAVIKKEKPSPHTVDEFTKATLHGGVDQIYKMKEPVELDDLFGNNHAEMVKLILVQGAAGVGKSTFAWEICREWKIKPSMKQFQLVVLIHLRHAKAHTASSLKDLMTVDERDPNLVTSIAQELVERDGAGLLLILDGYDELPSAKQQNSIFAKLLKGKYLPKATIIVTFRPSVSTQIERMCSDCDTMDIEILGFLQNNIKEYAECIFSQDKAMLASFLEYINSNPLISSMMHIPLNTAIVCELYKMKNTSKQSVPMTLTELYTELCFNLLYRYMKTQDLAFNEVDSVPDHILGKFACLPEKVKVQFDHLAEQAFGGVCNQRLIFNDLPDDFEHMGFMNKSVAVSALPLHKPSVSYNFFHLTLQEFLAAFHISRFPPHEQLEHLVSLIQNGNDVVLRFIAGLTQFIGVGWETILSHTGVHKDEEGISNCTSVVLNCLYEAHDPAFCAEVYPSGKVNYSPISATPFDLYALGYCIANSPCSWKICAIAAEGIAHIASALKFQASVCGQIGFIKVSSEGHKIYNLAKLPVCIRESLTDLNLSHCELDDSACNCLSNIIPSFVNLRRLDISDNPFMPGGALRLLQALGHLKNFQYLDLLRAKLSMDDLQALSLLLRPNGTLESLVIGEQATSTDIVEHMVDIVLGDSSLHSLNFMNIDLAQVGKHLASKLKDNTTLSNLMVWDKSFCIEGAEAIVKALQENHTLRSLTLMPWYKQHIPHHILSSISGERIQWFIFPECKK